MLTHSFLSYSRFHQDESAISLLKINSDFITDEVLRNHVIRGHAKEKIMNTSGIVVSNATLSGAPPPCSAVATSRGRSMSLKSLLTIFMIFLGIATLAPAQTGTGAAFGGPGLYETPLMADQVINAGSVRAWNSTKKLILILKDWLNLDALMMLWLLDLE